MRALAAIGLLLALLWAAFLASPYVAIVGLTRDVAARDGTAIAERINIYAVRASLVRQLVAAGLDARDVERFVPGQVGIGAGSLAAALGPVVAEVVTQDKAADLVLTEAALGGPAEARFGTIRDLPSLVWASRWRGFRNVSIALPPGAAADRQVRLHFRLSRLRWRIVAIDLPADARVRLARAVAAARDGT